MRLPTKKILALAYQLLFLYFRKYKNNNWYANANIFFVGNRMDVQYNGTFPSTIASIESLDAFTDINLNVGLHLN